MIKIEKSNSTIQSLQIGIAIVELIYKNGSPMRFTEIQDATGITKSNLYKYLNTLTQLDLLYRDKETNMYILGSRLIQYGMAAIGQNDLTMRVAPYMQKISTYTSCTVIFSVWTYKGPVTAKIWSSNHTINIGAQIGSILPPSSSAGKIFTVFLDQNQTQNWREDKSLTSYEMSKTEFEEIKQTKIAFAKEPLVPSISSASIPLFNYHNELIGVIGVVGFNESVPTSPHDPISKYLLDCHKEISGFLGYEETSRSRTDSINK